MNFTYTYKDRTGARCEAVLSAESRAEAFAMLKAKGVTPLSVREGGSIGGDASRGTAVRWGRGAVAGAVLVVAAGIAAWLILGRGDAVPDSNPVTVNRTSQPAETVPKRPSEVVQRNEPSADEQPAPATPAAPAVAETVPQEPAVETNAVEAQVVPQVRPKPTFKTGVEQVMGWIFTTDLGSAPPPLPNLSKKELDNIVMIILSKNEISTEDSEKSAQAKEAVTLAKKELKQYLENGGNPQSFLSYYHNELKKANDEWKDAQRLVLQSLKEDGADAGIAFAEEVNKKLAERGIKPVRIPPKYHKVQNVNEDRK